MLFVEGSSNFVESNPSSQVEEKATTTEKSSVKSNNIITNDIFEDESQRSIGMSKIQAVWVWFHFVQLSKLSTLTKWKAVVKLDQDLSGFSLKLFYLKDFLGRFPLEKEATTKKALEDIDILDSIDLPNSDLDPKLIKPRELTFLFTDPETETEANESSDSIRDRLEIIDTVLDEKAQEESVEEPEVLKKDISMILE